MSPCSRLQDLPHNNGPTILVRPQPRALYKFQEQFQYSAKKKKKQCRCMRPSVQRLRESHCMPTSRQFRYNSDFKYCGYGHGEGLALKSQVFGVVYLVNTPSSIPPHLYLLMCQCLPSPLSLSVTEQRLGILQGTPNQPQVCSHPQSFTRRSLNASLCRLATGPMLEDRN